MSKPTSAHTAGRLHVEEGNLLFREDGTAVAEVYGKTRQEAEANAARLALAYNSHNSLVSALRNLLDMVTDNRTHGPEVDVAAELLHAIDK